MSRENVEIVRQALDAYTRRDLDALKELHLRTWSWTGRLRGDRSQPSTEASTKLCASTRSTNETFEATVVVPDRFIDAGDSVVVPNVAYQRGRDGIEVSATSTLVYTIRGGRVARVRLYQDQADALKAVGLEE